MIQHFMRIYMYELEKYLSKHLDELQDVSFQSDEANTDRPLKEFMKHLIETRFNAIPSDTKIENLLFENNSSISSEDLKNIKINRVLLPEEITPTIKAYLRESKDAVYTNPDMCLELLANGQFFYETIELKSTKQDSIPGSSVQQILPNEWVIFVKHTSSDTAIATGQYIHAINEKIQFPDRSPRPQVSFKELKRWNSQNRILQYSTLIYKIDSKETLKQKLITDWQDVLAERWINMLFNSNSIRPNEPWFNNNMRKFILKFLEKYENLNDEEKQSLKAKISSLIM